MINAAADPLTDPTETADQPKDKSPNPTPTTPNPTPITPNTTPAQSPTPPTPSFPTHNPAQQNRNFMTGSAMPPVGVTAAAPIVPTPNVAPISPPSSNTPVSAPTGSGSTNTTPVMPAKPKFPDPTKTNLVKADGITTVANGSNNESNSNNSSSGKKTKNKIGFKTALGVIVLLFIVMGSGAGFYLTQQSQDLRQQASECIQECPGTDGVLRSCTPAEADGTAAESFCNSAVVGNIAICNDVEFCCNGASWTGDMTACTAATPFTCDDACTTDAECSDVNADWSCDTTSNTCRLTANPTSETCEEIVSLECNDTCSSDEECSSTNSDWSCDVTSSKCRLATNPDSITCAETVVTDPVSCDSFTGTLTNGTIADETTEMTYEIISSPVGDIVSVDFLIRGVIEGGDWVVAKVDDTPTDGSLTGTITYNEMLDLLVNANHDRQELIENGITYAVNSYGPDGLCQSDGTWSETGEACNYIRTCNGNILLESTTDIVNAVSCDSMTGTLTDGTVADKDTEMTYDIAYSGGELITSVDLVMHGAFEGPGWIDTWAGNLDDTPTDGIFSGSITYAEILDKLVATGHDRQQLIDEGIIYYVNVNGPDGFCHANGTWSISGEDCDPSVECNGIVALSSSVVPVACNETCAADVECQVTNTSYVCDTTTDTCRLDSNLTSESCETADSGDNDDDNSSDAIIGCNDTCVTNSDCSDTSHICVTTSDGSNKCRLESYTSSDTCIIPGSSGDQPSLPGELPESGPENWLNWLKAGLTTLGIGTALFLLL